MLIPKKVKHRKWQTARKSPERLARPDTRGITLAYGSYGIKVTAAGRIKSNQIEAARKAAINNPELAQALAGRIKELGGRIPFVMTPSAQRIFTFIDLKRAPDRVNKFGIIIGPHGRAEDGLPEGILHAK